MHGCRPFQTNGAFTNRDGLLHGPMKDQTTVDVDLEQQEGNWEFNEEVADNFDEHVRKSIPFYDEIQKRVIKISDWFLHGKENGNEHVYDLGCATGATIQNLVQYHGEAAPPYYVGVDINMSMLRKAQQRVKQYNNVNLRQSDVTNMSFSDATLILSLFTLSFVPEDDRLELLEQVHTDLDHGGGFVFVEKTRARSPFFQDIWNEEYWDFKLEQGLSESSVIGKAKTLRGQLRPVSVGEYESMLESAGFDRENVDIFFKWHPWTGFIARK